MDIRISEKSGFLLYVGAPCQRLHRVGAAERKCLCDAQDFPYISAGSADPDIKVWLESAQGAMKMASHQEVIFHIVTVGIPSTAL